MILKEKAARDGRVQQAAAKINEIHSYHQSPAVSSSEREICPTLQDRRPAEAAGLSNSGTAGLGLLLVLLALQSGEIARAHRRAVGVLAERWAAEIVEAKHVTGSVP